MGLGPEDAEDYAQDVAATFAEKPDSRQTVQQALIDVIRRDRGDPRVSKLRVREGHYEHVPEHEAFMLAARPEHRLTGLYEMLPPDEPERALIVLHFGWGLTLREVGLVFGVGEACMSLKLKAALRRLRRREK
jgi:DNA-directed RNA polymerase specialized sigma24 family protein